MAHNVLYKHALESIFAFLPIRDIALSVVAVSRRWNETIAGDTSTMRCLDAIVVKTKDSPGTLYKDLCNSPVARRHVGTLGSVAWRVGADFVDREILQEIASSSLKSLHTLYCKIYLPYQLCSFPASLTKLNIETLGEEDHHAINRLLQSIGLLSKLASLTLDLPFYTHLIQFAHIGKCTSLVRFNLRLLCGAQLCLEHIKQIRAMSQLESFVYGLNAGYLHDFLEEDKASVRWTSLSFAGHLDDRTAALVVSSPLAQSLVRLELYKTTDLQFLRLLPNLRELTLVDFRVQPEEWIEFPTNNNIDTLKLDWDGRTTEDHMKRIISRMPNLRTLEILCAANVKSLAFLSQVRGTLTSLTIKQCKGLRAIELEHIFALQQLTSLTLGRGAFGETLDSLALSHLRVPSRYIPTLARFDFQD